MTREGFVGCIAAVIAVVRTKRDKQRVRERGWSELNHNVSSSPWGNEHTQ